MPRSIRTIQRNRLFDQIALLAIVTPPAEMAADRPHGEHALGHGLVLTSRVDRRGGRVFRLEAKGVLVLRLAEGEGGDAIGFHLDGDWISIVEALAEPWLDFLGERKPTFPGSARRVHSNRSPYIARGPSHRHTLSGPEIALFLARHTASIGHYDPSDDNVMGYVDQLNGCEIKIIRVERDIILLVDCAHRSQLVAVLQRDDLDRPAKIRHRAASDWLRETLGVLLENDASIDPADLVAFARYVA
jgi:hypothetical protein